MENIDKVLEVLKKSNKPLKASEIAAESGIEKLEVDKIIKKLQKQDLVHAPVRCCYAIKSK